MTVGGVRTRFAPSPTGELHIGSLRTALFNWLFARHSGGSFVLRIEDTDRERSRPEFESSIIEDLHWLGLDPDEGPEHHPSPNEKNSKGPYRQSLRNDIYRTYAEELLERKAAYRCYCSVERLGELKEKQLKAGEPPRYDGACRDLAEGPEGVTPVIRFRVPRGSVKFTDRVHAGMSFDTAAFGDFVIIDSSSYASYNFAASIDDSLMEITHVIRGDDHLSNTPRQILIMEALSLRVPIFAHLPLVLGPDKTPLGKREAASTLRTLRGDGFLPDAILNAAARLGWSPGNGLLTLAEMTTAFDLKRLSKSPSVFDMTSLRFYNKTAIEKLSTEDIIRLAPIDTNKADSTMLGDIVEATRGNATTLKDFKKLCAPFISTPEMKENAVAFLNEGCATEVLKTFTEAIASEGALDEEAFKRIIGKVKKSTGEKGKKVFMPIRCALTGDTEGIELTKVIGLLGKEEVLKRLDTAIKGKL